MSDNTVDIDRGDLTEQAFHIAMAADNLPLIGNEEVEDARRDCLSVVRWLLAASLSPVRQPQRQECTCEILVGGIHSGECPVRIANPREGDEARPRPQVIEDERVDDTWTDCGRCGARFPTTSTCSNHD